MASRPVRVMPASMWHMPSVCTCRLRAPKAAMRSASTVESMSASSTAVLRPGSARIVACSSVVLPLPGALIRLISSTPLCFISSRRQSASRSLDAVTVSCSSIVFIGRSSRHQSASQALRSRRQSRCRSGRSPGTPACPGSASAHSCGSAPRQSQRPLSHRSC